MVSANFHLLIRNNLQLLLKLKILRRRLIVMSIIMPWADYESKNRQFIGIKWSELRERHFSIACILSKISWKITRLIYQKYLQLRGQFQRRNLIVISTVIIFQPNILFIFSMRLLRTKNRATVKKWNLKELEKRVVVTNRTKVTNLTEERKRVCRRWVNLRQRLSSLVKYIQNLCLMIWLDQWRCRKNRALGPTFSERLI